MRNAVEGGKLWCQHENAHTAQEGKKSAASAHAANRCTTREPQYELGDEKREELNVISCRIDL